MYYILLLVTGILIILSCKFVQPIQTGYHEEYLSPNITTAERGIAAFFIVMHHLSQVIPVRGPVILMRYIGFIMVAFFFFLSGYGLMFGFLNKQDYLRNFLRKRVLTILIPYWFVDIGLIIIQIMRGHTYSVSDYILSFMGIETITHTWFVTAIIILYLIFYVTFKLADSFENSEKAVFFLLGFFFIVYYLVCILFHVDSFYTASISAFLFGMLWHWVGNRVIAAVRRKYARSLICVTVCFAVLFSGRLALSVCGYNNEILHIILRNVISITFVLWVLILTQKILIKGKVLKVLGSASYEIYIVHYVVLYELRTAGIKTEWILILAVLISIVAAYLLHYGCEKLKKLYI